MTRATAARLAVSWMLAACCVAGCHADAPTALLTDVADAGNGPSVHRVPLALEGEELSRFLNPPFVDTTTPFESLVYDAAGDRFVVPGIYAFDRTGRVTFDAEALTGPAGARTRATEDLRAALRLESERDVIAAVWYGADAIVVLRAELLPSKANPHAPRRPDALVVDRLDPATLRLIDEVHLPLAELDPQATLDQFVRNGTIVAVLDLRHGADASAHSVSERLAGVRGRSVSVRLDPSGELTVLARGSWNIAASDLGLADRRTARRLFDRSTGTIAAGASADGVCTLEMRKAADGWQWYIACFDRDLHLRWRRHVPWEVSDWLIDDAGWIYLAKRDPASSWYDDAMEIVAVTPGGELAWRSPQRAPKGGMMAVGEELCFVSAPPRDSSRPAVPELVCLEPRHGTAR